MKKRLRGILKKVFIFIVTIFVIYLVVTNISVLRDFTKKDTLSLIVDTDAGYGIDDIFAVSRLIMEPDVQFIGLLSSQWHYADLKNDSTLYQSHDANYKLLRVFKRTTIPRYLGAELPILFDKKPWSPNNQAARFIANRAMEVVSSEKLNVLCLGSSTNLATALLRQPEAASKIRCYMMGPGYDPVRRVWDKKEFNSRNDLDALDLLLNNENLELHIMNANIAREMIFTIQEIRETLQDRNESLKYLLEVFMEASVNSDSVNMSSVALVQAILNPDLASEKQVFTPPENVQRKLSVYTRIDSERMKKDYLKTIEKSYENY
jgi:purine nucleosidase